MKKILGIGGIIIGCILLRLVPHAPNVAPMTALALLCGYAFSSRLSVLIPLAATLITDLFIGFYDIRVMAVVYVTYLIIALFGRFFGDTAARVAVGTFISSLFFFITTNGAVWAFSQWYARSPDGLLSAYMNGLPFLRNSLLGDLVYGGLLYAAYILVLLPRPVPLPAGARAASPLSTVTH